MKCLKIWKICGITIFPTGRRTPVLFYVVVVVVCLNRCVVQSRFLGSKKLNSLIDSTGLSHKFTVDKSLG